MPALDPLAVRVVRCYVAQVRDERVAREVQRRSEGLVTVREHDGDNDNDSTDAGDEATTER
jgi:hypothetical protein